MKTVSPHPIYWPLYALRSFFVSHGGSTVAIASECSPRRSLQRRLAADVPFLSRGLQILNWDVPQGIRRTPPRLITATNNARDPILSLALQILNGDRLIVTVCQSIMRSCQ